MLFFAGKFSSQNPVFENHVGSHSEIEKYPATEVIWKTHIVSLADVW